MNNEAVELVSDKEYDAMRHTCGPQFVKMKLANGRTATVDKFYANHFIPDRPCAKCVQKDLRNRQGAEFSTYVRPSRGKAPSLEQRDSDPSALGR